MDIERIYSNYSIPLADDSDKHYREGWINTSCPFCTGNPGYHLGFNIDKNYFYCWRCGGHPITKTLSTLLGISFREINDILRQYPGRSRVRTKRPKFKQLKFKFPSLIKPLTDVPYAVKYMQGRGFSMRDIKKIEKRFSLLATGFGSTFDNMDLSYRLVAPIIFRGEIVSWQSRDLTGNSELKYISCPEVREKIKHKLILYNETKKKGNAVVVEGIFDVWKLYLAGFKGISPFGVSYTYPQLRSFLLYDKLVSFLDPDRAGKVHAKELISRVLFSGKEGAIVKNNLGIDPGDMNVHQIKEILKGYI